MRRMDEAPHLSQAEILGFLMGYDGEFQFLKDLKWHVEHGFKLTRRQLRAAEKCINLEKQWQAQKEGNERGEYADIDEGIYRMPDGSVFKVQKNRKKDKVYAKRLILNYDGNKARFRYERGAVLQLKPEYKMSLEEAKEWGILYGTCCVCGATLSDEQSVKDGIGPQCAKRVMWSLGKIGS